MANPRQLFGRGQVDGAAMGPAQAPTDSPRHMLGQVGEDRAAHAPGAGRVVQPQGRQRPPKLSQRLRVVTGAIQG